MKELLALLVILSDSLLTFMNIQIEYYSQSITIIIYNNNKQVDDYESFHWSSDFEKNIVLRRAINWLLDQAIKSFNKGDNHSENRSQNIISKPS
jgi:hypothetical protein